MPKKVISMRTKNIPITDFVQKMLDEAKIDPQYRVPIGYLQTTRFAATFFDTREKIITFVENDHPLDAGDMRLILNYEKKLNDHSSKAE